MRKLASWMLAAAVLLGAGAGAQELEPPRLAGRSLVVPALPAPTVVGWGEVLLEVETGTDGRVATIRELRTTPPFAELVREAVSKWQFAPARLGEDEVRSQVLVAAVYRPRVLHNGPVAGTAPADVAAPAAVPYPVVDPPPLHPPTVLGDAVVIVEVRVGARGDVRDAAVLTAPSGFDASALEAARQWKFQTAGRGAPPEAYAYLIFGFREPVVVP